MSHIYLDANSTTPLDERVRQAMIECYESQYMNPASQHQPGQRARRRLEEAREEIASCLGAGPRDRLIFTSGGTESNNLALIGLTGGFLASGDRVPDEGHRSRVVVSSIEHPSVPGAAGFLESRGFEVPRLAVDASGRVRTETLTDLAVPGTRLVSLMLVNHETGVLQDVEQAAGICRQRKIPLHCDAVQAIGKVPVDFRQLGVSAMTLTAHKLQGPRGIGGLLLEDGMELSPLLFGGFQQLGWRPGTEDVALAVGFARCVRLAVDSLSENSKYLAELRDLFEATILAELPDAVINGDRSRRTPHTCNLSFPGNAGAGPVNRQALMMAADMAGVAISTGSACASGSSEPSPVLTAMGLRQEVVESSIRVSLSTRTTRPEIRQAAKRIIHAVKHLRQQKSGRK